MSDIQSKLEQVKQKESFLEKIARYIPGYKGYVDRDNSREIDTLLRGTLAKALESNKVKFKNTVLSLSQRGKLFETDGIDKLEKKLDTASAKFRGTSRGFSGAFDVVKVKEEKLNQLYAFDESLVGFVNEIEISCTELETNTKSNVDIEPVKEKISLQLDALIIKFTERENLLRSL